MSIDKLLPDFNHLTPEAASLGKYGTIAMTEYTGTPNIRIPLLEVKSGDVSYPIELYYDASGIKVEQNATFVGLGWNLSCGGSISHVVCGHDDFLQAPNSPQSYFEDSFSVPVTYCPFFTRYIANMGMVVSGDKITICEPPGDEKRYLMFTDLVKCYYTPDVFQGNFCGKTVSFYIDKEHNKALPLDENTSKYQISFSDISYSHPANITLTDDHGITYEFDAFKEGPNKDSYFLTHIYGLDGKNGKSHIELQYTQHLLDYGESSKSVKTFYSEAKLEEKSNYPSDIGDQMMSLMGEHETDGDLLASVSYHDLRGLVVESMQIKPDEVFLRQSIKYSFTRKPIEVKAELTKGDMTKNVTQLYVYNPNNDKIETMTIQVGNVTRTVASYSYDDIGRLVSVNRSGNAGSVRYDYNIRNWLKETKSDRFKQNLYYESTKENPSFNGNISRMQWQSSKDNVLRGYDFIYDGLNRLEESAYGEGADLSQSKSHYSEHVLSYSPNGSIERLQRYGKKNNGTFGLIDDLTYAYNGNQIKSISDKAGSLLYDGSFDFKDGADADVEYFYDANGALVKDLNKGICNIEYDVLGNLKCITFNNGFKTKYVYDAAGNKLRATHESAVTNTTDYIGNFIFEDGKLSKFLFDGGYCSFDNSQNPTFHYYEKDHLGSIRMVVNENGTIEQVNHYYPFGGVYGDLSYKGEYQKSKYIGKEFDHMYGLDWYDHGARMYDAAMVVWNRVDRLSEKYYRFCSYLYCGNNPVAFWDDDGMEVKPTDNSFVVILNTLSNEEQNYVRLNDKGFIDKTELEKCNSISNNFNCLKTLVESKYIINVTMLPKMDYISNGITKQENFGQVEILEEFKDNQFNSCNGNITGETGNLGVTYMPLDNTVGKGPIDGTSIDININPTLSQLGAAEAFSHEGYGHAYIYVTTNGDRYKAVHHYDGNIETNGYLKECSIKARKETVKNFAK
ncbi:hypothetical protein ONT16_12175 [Prevotella copri]|uniref:RHS repeat-associated core domain-containing protein n=1 Tax=Segatella copri TaxID=165179 RepID=A0AAP3BFW7_9BACT|nr:RHS repeat-associated core domain-containing protein [Segatella copri]MCW4128989.1 hypothetical protein [Segatella copri]MCW4415250.1 hypothetical protein [Segatella copri]MCW4422252.1 hypothetical protein [Segatella copri]